MTDLEMVKRCAGKMGEDVVDDGESCRFYDSAGFEYGLSYDPLTNDAQAMALVKKFNLSITKWDEVHWFIEARDYVPCPCVISTDLNRAIVECVARLP